jgi:hypothetical protein
MAPEELHVPRRDNQMVEHIGTGVSKHRLVQDKYGFEVWSIGWRQNRQLPHGTSCAAPSSPVDDVHNLNRHLASPRGLRENRGPCVCRGRSVALA